jgi:xanthosine utilization system XapX-like protein
MVRGVGSTSLLALDAPRRPGTGDSLGWVAAPLAVALVALLGLLIGEDDLGDAEPLMAGANVLMAMAGPSAAFVIYSHAAASRNRAYLALGSTYLAVGFLVTGAMASVCRTHGGLGAHGGERVQAKHRDGDRSSHHKRC